MPRLDGLDISTWNGKLDAKGAAAAGIKFVACQVGWTSRSDSLGNPRTQNRMVVDSWYRRNMDALRADAPNVKRIHYYVPVNRPWQDQMAEFAKITGPILPGETSMFDLEYEAARQLGWPALRAWMDAVEQRDQRKVFHYGEIFDQDDYPDRPKWPAHYGSNPATEAQRAGMHTRYAGVQGLTVWQYTSKLVLPYVADATANVDGNEILDQARFDAAFGGAPVVTGESHNPALLKAWTSDYQNREIVRPRGIVLHTIVNSGNVSWQDFRSGAHGNDSTRAQYVDRDGTAVEIQPPDRKFICSWQGDEFVIGGVKYGHIPYETEDAIGSEIGPYTAAQREAIIKALVEDCRMWGIPAVVPRVGDWTAAGIHYHSLHGLNTHHQTQPATDPFGFNYYSTQYGYWVRVVNPLTKTVGKTCPGAEKIAQHAGIVAEVARRLAGTPNIPPPEDDMTDEQAAQLANINAHMGHLVGLYNVNVPGGAGAWMPTTYEAAKSAADAVPVTADVLAELEAKIDALTAKVDALEPGTGGGGAVDYTFTGTATPVPPT